MSTSGSWNEKWVRVKPLDGGGQGDTLLVRSKSDEATQAVLKLLKPHKAKDPKARRRMYQEVTNLKILRSAGGKVPEVLDGNTDLFENVELPMYFVMEFVAGDTLADLVKKNTSFPVETSVGIALELCSTLRIAGKERIVHRDIKPENIIVRSITPPDVVMVDFGLSFNEDDDQRLTSVDEALDNKFLSLPERRGPGENKRDPRSDITDVCAILFYCLTGCSPRNLRDSQGRPPHRRTNYELIGRVQNTIQLALLNGLLDRGLNYELDARFQTVEELIGRLNEIANPAVKPPIEDLDVVAAREAAALRKHDRKTQLSDYFTNAQALGQSVDSCIVGLNIMLKKHHDLFSVSLLGGIERRGGRTDRGDHVAGMTINLAVRNHSMEYKVNYSIVAQGTECTLYRDVHESIPGKSTPVETGTVVMRYQGETELDRAAVVADIRETVTRLIPMLSQRIQSGY